MESQDPKVHNKEKMKEFLDTNPDAIAMKKRFAEEDAKLREQFVEKYCSTNTEKLSDDFKASITMLAESQDISMEAAVRKLVKNTALIDIIETATHQAMVLLKLMQAPEEQFENIVTDICDMIVVKAEAATAVLKMGYANGVKPTDNSTPVQ